LVGRISALVDVLTPDGAVDFVNRQVFDYFGRTLEELKDWSSTDAVHPDDLRVSDCRMEAGGENPAGKMATPDMTSVWRTARHAAECEVGVSAVELQADA